MFKILKIVLVVISIYVAVSCAVPWIKFFIFKNSAFKVINISRNLSHGEVVGYLLEKAVELKVPVKKNNIEIEEHEAGSLYTIQYQSVVGFPLIENKIIFAHEFSRLRKK